MSWTSLALLVMLAIGGSCIGGAVILVAVLVWYMNRDRRGAEEE